MGVYQKVHPHVFSFFPDLSSPTGKALRRRICVFPRKKAGVTQENNVNLSCHKEKGDGLNHCAGFVSDCK